MDKREARQYTSSNPPEDYFAQRRGSFLDRLFTRRRTSSTSSDDINMMKGMQRRGSIEPETTNAAPAPSITQRVQQEIKKPAVNPVTPRTNASEFINIFT